MAIDPDVQAQLDGVNARLAAVEAVPAGGGTHFLAFDDVAGLDSVVDFLNVLAATGDGEDLRLAGRLAAVDTTTLPTVPLPTGGVSFDFGVRYVHPAGSDTSDGYSTATPQATLQAAIDALPDTGGTIHLAGNQRHDVVDGLVQERSKRVAFTSPGRGARAQHHGIDLDGPVIYSSTGAQTLISFTPPSGEDNTYGFSWENINFELSPTTTKVFEAVDVNYMRVVDCGAQKAAGDPAHPGFIFIDSRSTTSGSNPGADSSWWRIRDNYVAGGSLVKAIGPNINQWVIEGNVNFPKDQPAVFLDFPVRCVIRDNNLEGGTAAAIYLKSGYGNRLDGNAGEVVDPWIILDKSFANLITDMGSVTRTTDPRVFVKLMNGAADNTIIVATGTGFWELYNTAEWIDETENGTAQNWFIAPSTWPLPRRVELEP